MSDPDTDAGAPAEKRVRKPRASSAEAAAESNTQAPTPKAPAADAPAQKQEPRQESNQAPARNDGGNDNAGAVFQWGW